MIHILQIHPKEMATLKKDLAGIERSGSKRRNKSVLAYLSRSSEFMFQKDIEKTRFFFLFKFEIVYCFH